MKKTDKIIFFDGVCGLCNGFVDFILRIDKKQQFTFSPLQSEFAQTKLPAGFTQDLKSVVYLKEGKLFSKSQAVIQILSEIGGLWKISKVASLFPLSLSNYAYDMIATNRYNLFGKKETCRIPSEEERSRFLV